jgi:hypothetical protein
MPLPLIVFSLVSSVWLWRCSEDKMKPTSVAGEQMGACTHLLTCLFALLLICLLALTAACTQTPTATIEAVAFTLVADTSTAPLIDELAAAYLANRPQVSIQVERAANTQRALEALRAGQFDLASISWPAFPGCPRGKKLRMRCGIAPTPATRS